MWTLCAVFASLRVRQEITVSRRGRTRQNGVVPLAVEVVRKRQNSEEDLAQRPSMGYACGNQLPDEE
jgi:hypothetical protein